jgi:hypothetical protein
MCHHQAFRNGLINRRRTPVARNGQGIHPNSNKRLGGNSPYFHPNRATRLCK